MSNLSSDNGSLWIATKNTIQYKVLITSIINPDSGIAFPEADKARLFQNHQAKTYTPHCGIQLPQHFDMVN